MLADALLMSALAATPLPKLVITHTMGMMPVRGGSGGYDTFVCATNSPYGGTARLSGLGGRDPKYADGYRWDLEMAEAQGVDVFGVLLSGNDRSAQFWHGWLETWEKMYAENPSLRIRLCPVYAGCDIAEWPENPAKFRYFKPIWEKYSGSKAWYRHDGRILFVGYKSPMWWDKRANDIDENLKAVEHQRRFFEFLGIGRDAYFIYDGTEYAPGQISGGPKGDPAELGALASAVCDVVDGYCCWGGVIPDELYRTNYAFIADAVRAKGKPWIMPIVDIHSLIGQFYRSLPGVQRLYDTWETAERTGAAGALLVTWNDWNESTSFAPSASFNYALSGLNAKLIHRFKHGAFPEPAEDEVFMFYRKYHADADPWPYVRGTVERDRDRWGETDDVLDVTVFAKAQGEARISGTPEGTVVRQLERGFNRFLLRTAVGREIAVRIRRRGKVEHELVSPERVTNRPWREDLLPWGWSSKCRENYDRYFGKGFRPTSQYSQRYEDGVEDWFRLYWWGTSERVAGSGPDEDPDGDGVSNREECLLRTNPLKANPIYRGAADWDTLAEALGPNTNCSRVAHERINLNPYPDRFGNPTHGFLYADKGASYDPKWMSKWCNNPAYGIGWTFRSGRKHSYRLGERGGIAMTLDPKLSGVYRFLPPEKGRYRVSARLHGGGIADSRLTVRLNGRPVAEVSCPRGSTAVMNAVTVRAYRLDKLDFVVECADDVPCTVELVPSVDFARRDDCDLGWVGRRVAFLGDSITDKNHIGCTSNYWNLLERDLGIVPLVYGRNGHTWKDVKTQAEQLVSEHPDGIEAIFVFAGTNDYNSNVPLGEWFEVEDAKVNRGGGEVPVKRRVPSLDGGTFRGRINCAMAILKASFPAADIFLMTPLHRGYAAFGPRNVQPDESYSNGIGLFVDEYVAAVKEAGNIWAVSVIDLNAESGLFPMSRSHAQFFYSAERDMLHPNDAGHERIEKAVLRHVPFHGQGCAMDGRICSP